MLHMTIQIFAILIAIISQGYYGILATALHGPNYSEITYSDTSLFSTKQVIRQRLLGRQLEDMLTRTTMLNLGHQLSHGHAYIENPPSAKAEDPMKVLVLYTGGTIGMSVDVNHPENGLVPIKGKLEAYCKSNPTLNDKGFNVGKTGKSMMALPQNETKLKRVVYLIYEYDNLIDSSNITLEHWKKIVVDIKTNYNDFDGFVVIHGTDTMAYTASALSFMFESLSKCVVITGSQKPIFDAGSDGKNNLITSILIAGNFSIPEVTIFFRDRLVRGNRSIKRAADSYYGFDSLNVPPLLLAGVQLIENQTMVRRNSCCFSVYTNLNPNVTVLRVHPSLPLHVVASVFSPPTEGVVLHTFGAGNIPSARKDLTDAIKAATDRGVIVVNCTQCPTGSVEPIYETGKVLEKLGVVFGADMTVEAALAKLMYILSKKKLTTDQKKDMMRKSIRGELTETA